ncbi:MAG TPA: hypothetical protein VHO23_02770 [Candidatus Paceibacterota bacterium]|nr:hypothetical protein [Candidatus Paceibacterota bacterium]
MTLLHKALIVLSILLAALLIGAGYLFLRETQPLLPALARYENPAYGIAFSYPETYVLSEAERGNGARGHYAITLTAKADGPAPENGEGPTAITVDIYQNNLDRYSLIEWVSGTDIANYKLSDGSFKERTIGGERALTDEWSGLYEGKTTTFLHEASAVAVTATYLTPRDPILDDYERVLASFELAPLPPITAERAIEFAQGSAPEWAAYPADSLPPKTIETAPAEDGWYVMFVTRGSGVPGILEATCFKVTHTLFLTRIGDFSAGGLLAPEALDPAFCQPAN